MPGLRQKLVTLLYCWKGSAWIFIEYIYIYMLAAIAQSVQRLATGWTVRGSNPGGGEDFRTRPERPWGLPSLLYNGYRAFTGVRRSGRGVDHPPSSSAEVEGRVELYICSPSRLSWPVLGTALPLPLSIIIEKLTLSVTYQYWHVLTPVSRSV